MKVKYNKTQLQSTASLNNKETNVHIKKLCSSIRISTNDPFNRNVIELILIPISKSISLEEEKLYLSNYDDENFTNYRNLIEDDNIRESCINYVSTVLRSGQEDIVHSQLTLRSFQDDSIIIDLFNKWKQSSITLEERHVLLAIFLDIIMLEIIQNNREKRSKSRVVNYFIDKLAKSGNKINSI